MQTKPVKFKFLNHTEYKLELTGKFTEYLDHTELLVEIRKDADPTYEPLREVS